MPYQALASACCGGGASSPALIIGEDRAQVSGAVVDRTSVTDVDAGGIWRDRGASVERSETLRLEGATLVSDRFQIGGSLPITKRTREGQSRQGLGDISLNAAYEVLPDWDYNPWRPKGLLVTQLTLPSAPSVFSAQDTYQLGARGRGFYSLGLGAFLVKAWGNIDALGAFNVHRSLAREADTSLGRTRLQPGFGGDLMLGAGYNLDKWRLGASLQWMYEDAVSARSSTMYAAGAAERLVTAAFTLNYLWQQDLSLSLSYTDQTWFGSPTNTTLARGVMVLLQKRWLR